jgi:hypothetical protein
VSILLASAFDINQLIGTTNIDDSEVEYPSTISQTPPSVCTSDILLSGSMEGNLLGNLLVRPGDTIKAGFDITVPGSHAAARMLFGMPRWNSRLIG